MPLHGKKAGSWPWGQLPLYSLCFLGEPWQDKKTVGLWIWIAWFLAHKNLKCRVSSGAALLSRLWQEQDPTQATRLLLWHPFLPQFRISVCDPSQALCWTVQAPRDKSRPDPA